VDLKCGSFASAFLPAEAESTFAIHAHEKKINSFAISHRGRKKSGGKPRYSEGGRV
jgi:hypothetical protein